MSGEPVNFYTVLEAAFRRGEVAFGYRIAKNAREASKNYGVVINPQKATEIIFKPQDKVIVLAENLQTSS